MSKAKKSDTQIVRDTIQRGSTILLMGPTGSGKSAFVNHLTKDENTSGGHDLQYQVKTSQFVDPQSGISVRLVDTPAFDDTRSNVSDTDVLAAIAGFLKEDDTNVNGILYFHRISDPRMGGPVKKNLKIFKELCGESNFSHVRVITTYWNVVDERDGKAREAALSTGPFKSLVKAGSKFVRHDQSVESARSIVNEFIHHTPFKLKIQEELDAGRRALGETSAGTVLMEEIKAAQDKVEKEAEAVRKEMMDSVYRGDDEKLMEQDRQRLEEAVERVLEERRKLETTRIGQDSEPRHKEKNEGRKKEEHTTKKTDNQFKRSEKKQKEANKSEEQTIPFLGQDQECRQQQAPKGQAVQMRHEVSSLLCDMVEVVKHCSKVGGEQLGGLGKLFGALVGFAVVNGVAVGVMVGLWFSLVVAAKRVVLGGGK